MSLEKTLPDKRKFTDVKIEFSKNSRIYKFWKKQGFRLFYKQITNSKHVIKEEFFKQQPEKALLTEFHCNNMEFGNWVSEEWRYNYIFSLIVSFLDLNYVLKFPSHNIGFNKLNLAIGARGAGKALAHYEPDTDTINITRYHRKDKEGYKGTPGDESLSLHLFIETGGIGSFAHEYGHFLDRSWSLFFDRQSGTFWRDLILDYSGPELQDKPENYFHIVINTVVNDEKTGQRRAWFKEMYEKVQGHLGYGSYWYRPTEIFARTFEVYVQMKLKDLNVKNVFLTKTKYESFVYPDKATMKKVIPKIDKILKVYREKLSSK